MKTFSKRLHRIARLREERGQMLALLAVSIVALTAAGAFVMDVGSWFRAHRATQSVADASALAAAQKLPAFPADAQTLAQEYSTKNGGGVSQIQFSSNTFANDTVSVRADRTAPGFLSNVLGISSVDVSATAKARAYNIGAARYVAPIGVRRSHPLIGGAGCPCFGQMTTVELETGNPSLGAFKILNVDGSFGGTGSQTLADWLVNGYDGYMPLGWYYSNPGAKFNPTDFEDAILARQGSELLFPVYDETREQGAGFEYQVVGWIGFYVQAFVSRGNGGDIQGYFTRVVWEGLTSESATPFFGATVVKLVD
jgi:Flp pilus assembly protein TadG